MSLHVENFFFSMDHMHLTLISFFAKVVCNLFEAAESLFHLNHLRQGYVIWI